ncbi:MAG: chorismate mutase [Acetobacteraceae bacterium]|nr:chorismate mutase [Acetobacteraceae bacterium]
MPLRAGREAEIIRTLLARHHGPMPEGAVVRIWRELLSAMTSMQAKLRIATCDPDGAGVLPRLAREHFGALTPVRVHGSPMQAISEARAGTAGVAVVPLPTEDEAASAAWWTALLHRDHPRVHVVARLPFWLPAEGGTPAAALAVSVVPPDPSGRDRSLVGLELPRTMSRARLAEQVERAGIAQRQLLVRRDGATGNALVLMETEGLLSDEDERLARLDALPRPPVVIGGYAVPVRGEAA